jgi:hypothetical protein
MKFLPINSNTLLNVSRISLITRNDEDKAVIHIEGEIFTSVLPFETIKSMVVSESIRLDNVVTPLPTVNVSPTHTDQAF